MEKAGFTLLLQDFCDYCPDFEAEVETFEFTKLGGALKASHNIRCQNRKRCAGIVENLKAKCKNE